jgi:YHS domain-containing protein
MQLGNVLYFLVWAVFFVLMMRFGCGAHIMGHAHHGRALSPGVPPDKAVDPVCGMTIPTQTAKSAVFAGSVFYFCSGNCRDKFEAAPATYANSSSAHGGQHHDC